MSGGLSIGKKHRRVPAWRKILRLPSAMARPVQGLIIRAVPPGTGRMRIWAGVFLKATCLRPDRQTGPGRPKAGAVLTALLSQVAFVGLMGSLPVRLALRQRMSLLLPDPVAGPGAGAGSSIPGPKGKPDGTAPPGASALRLSGTGWTKVLATRPCGLAATTNRDSWHVGSDGGMPRRQAAEPGCLRHL
jgi:hypothetical protein